MDEPRGDGAGQVGRDARIVVPVAPGGGGGRIARWVVVAAVLVAVAVVKPWGGSGGRAAPQGGGASSPRAVAGAPAASSGASEAPAANDIIDPDVTLACLDPGSWRVASVEAYAAQTIRVWRALEPGPASGPADPSIPYVLVVSEGVTELGWCAPVAGSDRPTGGTTVAAWSVIGGSPRDLHLVRTGRTPGRRASGPYTDRRRPSSGVGPPRSPVGPLATTSSA